MNQLHILKEVLTATDEQCSFQLFQEMKPVQILEQRSVTNDEWLSGVMFMSDRRGLIEQSWKRGRTG